MEYIYSALLLHRLGKEVNEQNVTNVIQASGAQPNESQVKSLVASLKGVDIDKELENAALVSSTPVSGGVEGAAKEEKKEEKPKEEKKEAAAEGLSALFG